MNEKIKVFLIDDHAIFRDGLKRIIEKEPQLEIVGEAGNGKDAISLLEKVATDILLLDISLPDTNGLMLIHQIRTIDPNIKIIILSMHSKHEYVSTAFEAGINGYVLKESASDKLIQGIMAVKKDEIYIDSLISHQIIKGLISKRKHIGTSSHDDLYSKLTAREQEVMRFLAEGFEIRDIANTLNISNKTVENHRHSIMNKLNARNAIDLARYAAKIGLIDLDTWTS